VQLTTQKCELVEAYPGLAGLAGPGLLGTVTAKELVPFQIASTAPFPQHSLSFTRILPSDRRMGWQVAETGLADSMRNTRKVQLELKDASRAEHRLICCGQET
jgi:hypothetical protein